MDAIVRILCAGLVSLVAPHPATTAQQPTLADLYRSGAIHLVPEFEVTDADLPEDTYFAGFEQAWSTSTDADGNIYLADFGAHNVKVFAPDGTFQRVLGREGSGPGEFIEPYLTTISRDRLVVWDMGNLRFCVLTLDGGPLSTRPLDRGEEGWPVRLQALPDGRILLQSEKRHPEEPDEAVLDVLRLYTSDMKYVRTLYEWETRRYKRVDMRMFRRILRPFPAQLIWAVLPDGRVALGSGDGYHIEFHDVDDGLVGSFDHTRKPVRVTAEDRERWLAGITITTPDGIVQEGATPEYARAVEFPQFMPAFDLIMADSEGNLLVHAARADQQEERGRYRFYDAFTAAGAFLGEVTIEGDGRFPGLGAPIYDGAFTTCLQSDVGEITLVHYRITGRQRR